MRVVLHLFGLCSFISCFVALCLLLLLLLLSLLLLLLCRYHYPDAAELCGLKDFRMGHAMGRKLLVDGKQLLSGSMATSMTTTTTMTTMGEVECNATTADLGTGLPSRRALLSLSHMSRAAKGGRGGKGGEQGAAEKAHGGKAAKHDKGRAEKGVLKKGKEENDGKGGGGGGGGGGSGTWASRKSLRAESWVEGAGRRELGPGDEVDRRMGVEWCLPVSKSFCARLPALVLLLLLLLLLLLFLGAAKQRGTCVYHAGPNTATTFLPPQTTHYFHIDTPRNQPTNPTYQPTNRRDAPQDKALHRATADLVLAHLLTEVHQQRTLLLSEQIATADL